MEQNGKLKLFISYSHLDENHIKEFIKHLTPLKTNGLIEDWYDRKIIGCAWNRKMTARDTVLGAWRMWLINRSITDH